MPTINDVKARQPRANILGYGVSGAGKTTFLKSILRALQANKPHPRAYIFNWEKNNLYPLSDYEYPEDIEYDDYESYDKFLAKIVELKRSNPYDVVMLDGGAAAYRMLMQQILRLAKREVAQLQDWGLTAERLKLRIADLISLDSIIYVTFHEQLDKDDTNGKTTGRILVPGKALPDELPPLFNLFLRFEVTPKRDSADTKRVLRCAADPVWPAGDKFGALASVEEPDFAKIWAKITTKLASGSPAVALDGGTSDGKDSSKPA